MNPNDRVKDLQNSNNIFPSKLEILTFFRKKFGNPKNYLKQNILEKQQQYYIITHIKIHTLPPLKNARKKTEKRQSIITYFTPQNFPQNSSPKNTKIIPPPQTPTKYYQYYHCFFFLQTNATPQFFFVFPQNINRLKKVTIRTTIEGFQQYLLNLFYTANKCYQVNFQSYNIEETIAQKTCAQNKHMIT
eukprot:TRINITY_DN26789_c0_g1_i3.p3 TRINITY_DN26789_c0_g1~~TRINITY_DN26789_c0_g1_i3.p3  ORF type:complete len:189 (-),score=13.13 TRINITY_DN26789_c0_g1_i3:422-988(-)